MEQIIITNSNKMEDLYCDLCGWTGHPKHAKYTHDDNGDAVLTCPKDCQIYDFQTELEVMNTVDVDGYKLLWYDHKPTAEYVEKELRV